MAKGGKRGGSGASKSASAATVKVQEDVWAQCDNPNCQKWRRLPPGTIIDENTPWYCYMNPDEENAACEAPEESYRLDVELEPGYEELEYKAASTSRQAAGNSKSRNHADRGKSSSKSNQQASLHWQGTQRSHSGGTSQASKRRADSGPGVDPPYASKRARTGISAEANGHAMPAKPEADAGIASDLQGTSSGGLRHSLRPKRPPSYPLKEESPPPPGPSRQSGSRQGQGSSRPPSGQSQRAQAAATRPTQKARKQHKGFEKLLALGGLWEIVKGKGKAITPAPFWVWEGLATHTPAAAELAAQAADVASAARYFEGNSFPSGAALAVEAAALKRQAMTAAAVLGLDATSQIPDVVPPVANKPAAAVAAAPKAQQPAAVQPHAEAPSQSHLPPAPLSQGHAVLQTPSHMPAHGNSQSLSQTLAQTQPQSQTHSQPQSQFQSLSQPPAQSQSGLQLQSQSVAPAVVASQAHPQLSLHAQHQQQLLNAQLSRQMGQAQSLQAAGSQLLARLPPTPHQQQQLQQQGGQLQSSLESGLLWPGPALQPGQQQQAGVKQPSSHSGVASQQSALQPEQQQPSSSAGLLEQPPSLASQHQSGPALSQEPQRPSQAAAFPQSELPLNKQNGSAGPHFSADLHHQTAQQRQHQQISNALADGSQHGGRDDSHPAQAGTAQINGPAKHDAVPTVTGCRDLPALAQGSSADLMDAGN